MQFQQALEQLNNAKSGYIASDSAKVTICKHPGMPMARADILPGGAIQDFEQATQAEMEADDWVFTETPAA